MKRSDKMNGWMGSADLQPRRWMPLLLILLLATAAARAQLMSSGKPLEVLQKVGVDQKLGDPVPGDLSFLDESGRMVRLGDYFGQQPLILALVYYECPMLCPQVLEGLARSLRPLSLSVGQDFGVIAVSINPEEDPATASQRKTIYLERYNRPGASQGWHFLTGDQESIERLAQAVGFRYTFDPATQQYVHAAAIAVLTTDGVLARYFYGIEYPSRDLRLGLVEASSGRIGTAVDQLLLYCYHYDPTTGKYGLIIMNVLRLAGAATVLALGSFILIMLRRDRLGKGDRAPTGFAR